MPEIVVVDCSVAAKWILPEEGRAPALKLLDRSAAGEVILVAPDILLAEFASLIAKRHRQRQITAEQAEESFMLMATSELQYFDTRSRLYPALHLSLTHHPSLWDCVYLALAAEHDSRMITADKRLFRGGGPRHPAIRLLA